MKDNGYFERLSDRASSGTCKAYCAFMASKGRGLDELEMNDYLRDDEVRDFLMALRRAAIESFVLTGQSRELMANIHSLVNEGCMIDDICTVTRKATDFLEEETLKGLRLVLDC